MSVVLWILALLLVLVGLIGVLLPILPGAVLVFLGLVLAAWADGFTRVEGATIALLGALTVAIYAIDVIAGWVGAGRLGASRRGAFGALVGAVVGLFFGFPGVILGPFVGAVVGEYTVRRKLGEAGRAGVGAWLGLALGAAAKVALVFVMLGVFAAAYLL